MLWYAHSVVRKQIVHYVQKTLAGKAHLNSFEMVELFKTEQSHMEASILQLAAGGTLRSKGVSRKKKKKE